MEALASGLAQTFCMVCNANSKTKDGSTYAFLPTLIETNAKMSFVFTQDPRKQWMKI